MPQTRQKRRTTITSSIIALLLVVTTEPCWAQPPAKGAAPRSRSFIHHEDSFIRGYPAPHFWRYSGEGPAPSSIKAKQFIDSLEGRPGVLETMGIAIQQLLDDYPETIEKIKQLRIPINRYGGEGHVEPAPVGRMRGLSGMTLEEAIKAEWDAETHTLVPNWHFEDGKLVLGNPRAGQPITWDELPQYNIPQKEYWLYGGTLALESILGVIPIEFGLRTVEDGGFPTTPVKRALGMNNWPNPAGSQWDAENAPLEFFKHIYGVSSFKEVLDMPCPVDKILAMMSEEEKQRTRELLARLGEVKRNREKADWRNWETRMLNHDIVYERPAYIEPLFPSPGRKRPDFLTPTKRRLSSATLSEASQKLVSTFETEKSLPAGVKAGGEELSLSELFKSLAFAIEEFTIKEVLPKSVEIEEVLGPVDAPLADQDGSLVFTHDVTVLREFAQAASSLQQLLYLITPKSNTLSEEYPSVNEVNILHSAWLAAREMRSTGQVPSLIPIYLPTTRDEQRGRPRDTLMACNAAEFLVAMAREYIIITEQRLPGPVTVTPVSMTPQQLPTTDRLEIARAWSARASTANDEKTPKRITAETLGAAVDSLLQQRPRGQHDGDPGGPPDYIKTEKQTLSLAELYQALAINLSQYQPGGKLSSEVEVLEVLGPVDYPMYELREEPHYDPEKRIGGWHPFELKREYFPDPRLIAAQGIGGSGEWGTRPGAVDAAVLLQSATVAAQEIETWKHIPGVVPVETTTGEMVMNAAEMLYAMAQVYSSIRAGQQLEQVSVSPTKIVRDELCQSVTSSTPVSYLGGRLCSDMTMYDRFTWRAKAPKWLLNRAWTYVP